MAKLINIETLSEDEILNLKKIREEGKLSGVLIESNSNKETLKELEEWAEDALQDDAIYAVIQSHPNTKIIVDSGNEEDLLHLRLRYEG